MRRRSSQPESPLVRLLRDPAGELHHLVALIQHALAQAVPYLGAVAGLALALTLALWLLRRQRARRLAEGARLVRIAVPPELDPQAAGVLWKSLHDLLRPPLARLLQGQPHVAWRSEEHTSELQSHSDLVCRLLLEKKNSRHAQNPKSRH